MIALIVAIGFTIGVSAICSILEAMILSTTTSDIESLKQTKPKLGKLLEYFRNDLEETISAILSLNTIANTLGATLVGGLAAQIFGENRLLYFSIGMTIGILIFSEVIPKNIGVIYRNGLQSKLVRPLQVIRVTMRPVSYICKVAVYFVIPKRPDQIVSEDDIRMMAAKSEKDGNLTQNERQIINNALTLDDIQIDEIMTPRTVVMALEKDLTIKDVFEETPDLAFARIPVCENNIDNIVGIVRRRDLLKSKADDEDRKTVEEHMQEPTFVLGSRTAADALHIFLQKNQQIAIVIDEYGSVQGVVTMEDVIEHILGREIFEEDDPAIDMRELAKSRNAKKQILEVN